MDIFDGFISAVASEFKIMFHKDSKGSYKTTLEFDNGRTQEVLVTLSKDESGDNPGEYVDLWCQKDGKKLTMGILEHTARRGCCSWKKPKPEEMFPSDEDKTGKKFGIWRN